MRPADFFRGMRPVARQEFISNVKSIRFLVMAFLVALVIVGGAYGISASFGGGGGPFGAPPLVVWPHPAYAANGSHIAVAWVSDPYGGPRADIETRFTRYIPGGGEEVLLETRTDANGFARFDVGNLSDVGVTATTGTATFGTNVQLDPRPTRNFTLVTIPFYDLDNNRKMDDLALHVVDLSGNPVAAHLYINGTFAKDADAHGYALLTLPPGRSNVTIEVGSEQETQEWETFEIPDTGFGDPNGILTFAAGFNFFIVPIFAIVITFDAISKERVQGTLDLLLSRPVSRTGVLLGKFFGAFLAVAFPVTLVNLVGVGVISGVSGRSPSGTLAAAFVGLGLLLIAFYVLMQLVMSTLAKTTGTAILFGVLLWLLFTILYTIVTLVLAFVLFANDPASAFRFLQVVGLANPSLIYLQLVTLSAPSQFQGGPGSTSLDAGLVGAAAVVWLVLLFALALWTFHRKAAQ